jgi:YfiR/HmsC-like
VTRAPASRALRSAVRAVLVLSLFLAPGRGRAGIATAAGAPSADDVKAALLYNFGKFVVWPSASLSGDGTFVIGVLGDDPMVDALQRTVRDKSLGERRVVLRRVAAARDARVCQILFVGAGERHRLAEILDALEGARVLTVSDMSGFADRGGMINLLLEGGRYRFEINLQAAERAGLQMSSQLLKLARRVIGPPGRKD